MAVLPSLPAQLGAHKPFAIAVLAARPGMSLGEGQGLINPSDEIIITLEAFFTDEDELAEALALCL